MSRIVLAALFALLGLAGCGGPGAGLGAGLGVIGPSVRHPELSAQQLAAIALRADEVRVQALGLGAERGSAAIFAGPAADLLRRQAVRTLQRHEHFETLVDARAVVHSSATAAGATAVVETSGRQRLVTATGASAWDRFVDQWEYTLRWSGGWRVWQAVDLPPDQWWPA